jgi:hypothetical protein
VDWSTEKNGQIDVGLTELIEFAIFFTKFHFSVFDSWSKPQSGLFSGNFINYGQFDQCINFLYKSEDEHVGLIRGKHCQYAYIKPAISNASLPSEENSIYKMKESL